MVVKVFFDVFCFIINDYILWEFVNEDISFNKISNIEMSYMCLVFIGKIWYK